MPTRHFTLAELLADVPYRVEKYGTVLQDGRKVRINYTENDHCCARFALLDEWLRTRALQAEGRVGYAHARLARSCDIVQVTLAHLAQDPLPFCMIQSRGVASATRRDEVSRV